MLNDAAQAGLMLLRNAKNEIERASDAKKTGTGGRIRRRRKKGRKSLMVVVYEQAIKL